MAKAILDINIQAGYPYEFIIDLNDIFGTDLENDYLCYFECESMGNMQFSVNTAGDAWEMTIPKETTNLLTRNLEEYVVYAVKTTDSTYEKLLSGRIHVDKRVRS